MTGLAWFTDLDVPVRDALGLTSQILDCDRTQHRFIAADTEFLVPYWVIRRALNREYRTALEAAPGAMLMHWWVSRDPVKVQL